MLRSNRITRGTISELSRAVLCGLASDRIVQVAWMMCIETEFGVLRRIARRPLTGCASASGWSPDSTAFPRRIVMVTLMKSPVAQSISLMSLWLPEIRCALCITRRRKLANCRNYSGFNAHHAHVALVLQSM